LKWTVWKVYNIWRVSSSGIWRPVVCWVAPDVSEERWVQLNGLHGVISQKMILFITTAVKTSNPIYYIYLSDSGRTQFKSEHFLFMKYPYIKYHATDKPKALIKTKTISTLTVKRNFITASCLYYFWGIPHFYKP
jgi:hypothetical protein